MTRSHRALVTVLGFVGLSLAVLRPAGSTARSVEKPSTAPYLVGATWVYRSQFMVKTERVTRVEPTARGKAFTVTLSEEWGEWSSKPEKAAWPEHKLAVTGEGLYALNFGWAVFSPPVCLLKHGCQPGDGWETETTRSWPGLQVEGSLGLHLRPMRETWVARVEGWGEVHVPAGRFRAVRVHYWVTPDEMPASLPSYMGWYVPGVGFVQWAAKFGSDYELNWWVLTSFTPGKGE